MLNNTNETKRRLMAIDAQIEAKEKQIQLAEARQTGRRKDVEQLHTRRKRLERELAREEAQLVKPMGPYVELTAPNGDKWRV